jgi:hypothetical protein
MPLPQAIAEYWNANTVGLPQLFYEYSPEEVPLPVAIYDPAGFYFDAGNLNFRMDTYRYTFNLYSNDAPTTYQFGFVAISFMYKFAYPGLIMVTVKPGDMATPMTVGQQTVWNYEFSVDFQVQVLPAGA